MNIKEKIVSLSVLKKKVQSLKKKGKAIAFTNGCFDILHYGHVSYLLKAKAKNRILVVGLNSDASVRKIKGPQRPINSQNHRAFVLAALDCVDFVTVFNQPTPLELIKAIGPHYLVKGADWKNKEVVGAHFVQSYGGQVELIQYVPQLSTTKIIEAIQKTCKV